MTESLQEIGFLLLFFGKAPSNSVFKGKFNEKH